MVDAKQEKILKHLSKYEHKEKPIRFTQREIRELEKSGLTHNDILFYLADLNLKERQVRESLQIISMIDRFNRSIDNYTIIEQNSYKGITYIIKQVNSWFCAYIITKKEYKIGDLVNGQEITYYNNIEDCDFVRTDEKINGKYVVGWDYAHSYNMGTPIDSIMEDIKKAIETITEEKSK